MPIYEYACQACGHHFEVLQGINETALVKCRECKKNRLQKLVSATSFQLKGNGWYVTDFKNSGKKEAVANKQTATDTGSPKAEQKTEKSADNTSATTSATT